MAHICENDYEFIAVFKDTNGKTMRIRYSKHRYGVDLAYLIAKKSIEIRCRVHDYYETYGDITKFYINSHKHGVCVMTMDTEDVPKITPYKISILKNRYTYYADTKDGPVHRLVFDELPKDVLVDHYNKNGLDNRKANLRPVTCSINNRNAKLRIDNSTGVRGVSKEHDIKYRATWIDTNGKMHSKTYSITKYGESKAKQLAIDCRLSMEKENEYISIQEGSETTSDTGIMVIAV